MFRKQNININISFSSGQKSFWISLHTQSKERQTKQTTTTQKDANDMGATKVFDNRTWITNVILEKKETKRIESKWNKSRAEEVKEKKNRNFEINMVEAIQCDTI